MLLPATSRLLDVFIVGFMGHTLLGVVLKLNGRYWNGRRNIDGSFQIARTQLILLNVIARVKHE